MSDEILPGDVVAVNHGLAGRQEGLVVGSHIDYLSIAPVTFDGAKLAPRPRGSWFYSIHFGHNAQKDAM
ncbi:hypothetical protein HHX47_DHR5000739 [Lentinula edodes]|nr:hypothetical protein HHX47_DHR5000739 [Lentinula edodes]